MAFLYPAFLAGAAAIAIPIVLHLLRRDVAPEVPFSAVRLLRKTPLEQTRRRRLRDLVLLAARIAALVLLAFAFARPYFTDPAREPALLILAIDRSYSMGGRGQFDRALALANEVIDSTGRGNRIAVVAFDDRAEVLAPAGSAADARGSLQGLRAGFGATRYGSVLTRAMELSERGPARLIIVTDRQRAGWENEDPIAVPPELQIETRDVGATSSNVGVVGIRRDERGVVASIRNEGREVAAGNARAIHEGRAVASAPFSVPPGGTAEVLLPYQAPSRGSLAVEIDDPSGYPADDARYAVLDSRGRTRVLIVGDGAQAGFYLTRALQAAEPQDGFEVRLRSPRTLGSMPPEEFSSHRTVLLLSTRSLDRRARELLVSFVREGGGLLVTAAAEVEPSVLAAVMEWPDFSAIEQDAAPAVLAATDLRHPIFRPFGALAANLGQVRFSRAWLVRGDGWDVAARFTDGSAALLERREGKGRVLLFASDLDRRWNDFPLHSTFVPFAVEAVRHLAAADPRRREYVVASAPAGAPPQPGAYVLPSDGRLVAVNVDVREGGTSRMNADEFLGMVQKTERQPSAPVQRRAQQIEAQQGLWRYGVLFMLAALVTESIVGRGR